MLSSLLRGCSMKDLAIKEGLSYKTISAHKRNGLIKLGIKNMKLLINDVNKDVLNTLSFHC
ncbi:hypothetical protein H8I69_21375 [Serratia fonticola]|nr:hypothetical protein [Serratia fonticola]NYA40868.1 hypothetical protein [Serratia fonticola]